MFNRNVLITLLLLISFTTASAQDCIDYTEYLHVVNSAPLFEGLYNLTKAADTVSNGEYFYLAMEDSGIVTGRITADDEIIILGTVPTWDRALALALLNDRLFVADGRAGLQVFDISDPASPQWMAHIDTPGWATHVEAVDNRVFIMDDYLGLVVIDTHEVRSPRIIASLVMPGIPRGMAREGGLIFMACESSGVVVISIADPDQPVILHTLDIPTHIRDLAVTGNLLAVADQYDSLQFYTMITPQQFELRGSLYNQDSSARRLEFHDGLLLFGGYGRGIGIINADDPDAPFVQGQHFSAFGTFYAFTMIGDRLLAVNTAIDLLDFTTPQLPPLLGSADVPGYNRNMAVYGNYAYVSNNEDGLRVVDLNDLSAPTISPLDTSTVAGDIGVHGEYLYATGVTNDVDIYSLDDPASPQFVSSVVGGAATHLSFRDNTMIITGYNQLFLYDLTFPAAPQILFYRPVSGVVHADIQGQYLYIALGYQGGIEVWDISSLNDPHQVSSYDTAYFGPKGVIADGNYLYVSCSGYRKGLVVLDISDPLNIWQAAELPMKTSAVPPILLNKTLYWCSEYGPIQLVDIQDPTNPLAFSSIGNQSQYIDLDIHNNQLVAMNRAYGLDVALRHCPALSSADSPEMPSGKTILSAYPNPFNPQTTIQWVNDKPRHLKMTVYDLAGRRVAVLADRIFQAGPCSVDWNGRTDDGLALPSGIFLVSLKGDNIDTSGRISLVR